MQALTVENLRKQYANDVVALGGVSLAVEEGDFFSLLGPNGAGKTTLIGIICGLVNKTDGLVRIFGRDIDKSPDEAKSFVGVVPQEFNFNIFENIVDIVVNQGGYYGLKRSLAVAEAEKLLKNLGLWEKRHGPALSLSGGMKRRLMIARALVHNPRLLMLDEPTAGVDVELRRGMWDFLRRLNERGMTIIMTTHYLEEAEQLSRRVAIINNGLIVRSGSVRELLTSKQTESFLVYFDNPLPTAKITNSFIQYNASLVDPTTLEIHVSREYSLKDFLVRIEQMGYIPTRVKNKSNRLEEIFLDLIDSK